MSTLEPKRMRPMSSPRFSALPGLFQHTTRRAMNPAICLTVTSMSLPCIRKTFCSFTREASCLAATLNRPRRYSSVLEFAINRRAIYVYVVDSQENADRVSLRLSVGVGQWRNVNHFAIGGRDYQMISGGNLALGVSKEVAHKRSEEHQHKSRGRKVQKCEDWRPG